MIFTRASAYKGIRNASFSEKKLSNRVLITDNLCLQGNNEFSKVLKLKDPTMIFFAKHDLGALINVIRTILIEFHSTGRTLHYVNYFFSALI